LLQGLSEEKAAFLEKKKKCLQKNRLCDIAIIAENSNSASVFRCKWGLNEENTNSNGG
jgi:hypothetical protein